ncbi:hypothetical protein EV383_4451 [Pseudonocardia sediminis]|uniref:Uncharacterized protein n=1 Tax=Pseudonocardia sediminis TaxID=1397368 RepID=A0A4Q7UZU3_PSEST|nr:hypothetical protein [Pseudonocardia sediminis]RZT87526.1 hypothetical protein EV383_4451 [Pseudonocardia sediminis]
MPALLPRLDGDAVMTDARFPDRWLTNRQILGLPADAFRLFVIANAWAVSNRTDGRIDLTDLSMMPDPAHDSDRSLLVETGLWEADTRGYVIAGFANVQTTAAQLAAAEQKLAADRLRKAKSKPTRSDVPPEAPSEFRATVKDRQGPARTGRTTGTTTDDEFVDFPDPRYPADNYET